MGWHLSCHVWWWETQTLIILKPTITSALTQIGNVYYVKWLELAWTHIISQFAGAAIIYEVQRSARSEARKEEVRKQEMEVRWQPPTILLETLVYLLNETWHCQDIFWTTSVRQTWNLILITCSSSILGLRDVLWVLTGFNRIVQSMHLQKNKKLRRLQFDRVLNIRKPFPW